MITSAVPDFSQSVIGPENLSTISTDQIKTKTNPDLVRHVFLHLIIVAFTNWLTMMSSLAPIDWWYYIDWFCLFWNSSDTA